MQASSFYGRVRRTHLQTMDNHQARASYIVPPACGDSDMEIEDEVLDEDDDVLDPDYLLNTLITSITLITFRGYYFYYIQYRCM